MITKTLPINTRIVISYSMKWGIPFWVYWKVRGNWDNYMIKISQWRESQCRTNTSARRKKQIKKSRTTRVTVRDLSRKVNHLSKVIWDRKIITEFTRSINSTSIGESVLMMDVKVSKTNTLAYGLIKRTSSMLDEIELKTMHNDKDRDRQRKEK